MAVARTELKGNVYVNFNKWEHEADSQHIHKTELQLPDTDA